MRAVLQPLGRRSHPDTQFSTVDTAARFDAGAQTNARFGQYTAALGARKAQVGLKFAF